jgi:hypothetical protein
MAASVKLLKSLLVANLAALLLLASNWTVDPFVGVPPIQFVDGDQFTSTAPVQDEVCAGAAEFRIRRAVVAAKNVRRAGRAM